MQEISQGKENAQQELQWAWLQGDIDQPTYAILVHYQNLPDDYSGCLQKQGMLQISRHYAEQLQANPERAAAIYSHALQTQKMFKQACEYYQDDLVGMLANPKPEGNLVNGIINQQDQVLLAASNNLVDDNNVVPLTSEQQNEEKQYARAGSWDDVFSPVTGSQFQHEIDKSQQTDKSEPDIIASYQAGVDMAQLNQETYDKIFANKDLSQEELDELLIRRQEILARKPSDISDDIWHFLRHAGFNLGIKFQGKSREAMSAAIIGYLFARLAKNPSISAGTTAFAGAGFASITKDFQLDQGEMFLELMSLKDENNNPIAQGTAREIARLYACINTGMDLLPLGINFAKFSSKAELIKYFKDPSNWKDIIWELGNDKVRNMMQKHITENVEQGLLT